MNTISKNIQSDLLTDKEAAKILNIAAGTLGVWRSTGHFNLPYLKIGGQVRYSRKALEKWIEGRVRTPGGQK